MNTARRYDIAVFSAVLLYTIAMSLVTSLKHYTFHSEAFDLGIFLRLLNNNINGEIWKVWVRAEPTYSPYFPHVSPLILYLLTPLYFIFRSPYMLLVIQSAFIAFAAIYIYRIACSVLNNRTVSSVFAVSYLIHPGLLWANLYDFHLEAFIPLFLSMMYYYWLKGSFIRFVLSSILLLTVADFTAPIVVAFIFYTMIKKIFEEIGIHSNIFDFKTVALVRQLKNKKTLLSISLAVAAVFYFIVAEQIRNTLWPARHVYEKPVYVVISIENIAHDIWLKIAYIAALFLPVAFLPLYSIVDLIPAAPYFVVALLSRYTPYYTLVWQYPAIVVVSIYVAAVNGYKKISLNHSSRARASEIKLLRRIIAFSLLALIAYGPPNIYILQYAPGFQPSYISILPSQREFYGHRILELIPQNSSVLVQENIYPHLTHIKTVYTLWPKDESPPEYIVIDYKYAYYLKAPLRRVAVKDSVLAVGGSIIDQAKAFLDKDRYGVYAYAYGILLLKHNYTGTPKVFIQESFEIPLGILILEHGVEIKRVGNTHVLRIPKNFNASYYVWHGPWMTLPPGKYTLRLNLSVPEDLLNSVNNISIDTKLCELQVIKWNPDPGKILYFVRRAITMGDALSNTVIVDFAIDGIITDIEVVIASWSNVIDIRISGIELSLLDYVHPRSYASVSPS